MSEMKSDCNTLKVFPLVSIIILNWNGWRNTLECLESLYKITYPNYEIIVIDNGSTDQSIVKIREHILRDVKSGKVIPGKIIEYIEQGTNTKEIYQALFFRRIEKITIIENEKNYGFAEGNNVGIRYILMFSKSRYILLMNNDAIVDSVFLTKLIDVANSRESIGVAGSKIYDYYDTNIIQYAGARINYRTYRVSKLNNNETKECSVDTVLGCSMVIKRELIDKIGLLDKEYFAYEEENDFCIRAKRAGYEVVYVPKSKVLHKGAASSGGGFNTFSAYYKTRNKILLIRKNFPLIYLVPVSIHLIGFMSIHSLESLRQGRIDIIVAMIKGIVWHLKNPRLNSRAHP